MLTGIKLGQIHRKSVNHKFTCVQILFQSWRKIPHTTVFKLNLGEALTKLSSQASSTFVPHKILTTTTKKNFTKMAIKHWICDMLL